MFAKQIENKVIKLQKYDFIEIIVYCKKVLI